MTSEELLFFNQRPAALPLYEVFAARMQAAFPCAAVQVHKTQITFHERHGFAFVSLRRVKGCPDVFLLVTFGLARKVDAPRIFMAVEPYPGRWTHHVVVQSAQEMDAELMAWLEEAHAFALVK